MIDFFSAFINKKGYKRIQKSLQDGKQTMQSSYENSITVITLQTDIVILHFFHILCNIL